MLNKKELFILFKQKNDFEKLSLVNIPSLSKITRLPERATVKDTLKNGQALFMIIKRDEVGQELNAFINTSSQFSQNTGTSILTSNAEELKWRQLKDGCTDLIQFENESLSSKNIQSDRQSNNKLLQTATKLAKKEHKIFKKKMKN